ncbi:MAG: formate/nitrite transporter family protein [Clostridia bacterium]|nr:formate/nitrite transporter family protein [Clostridia bacterium]
MIKNSLIKSILAGISIGIGALAYLSIENKVIGGLFFSIGLFVILNFNLNLYTGKICYVIEKKNYLEVAITLLGNFIGVSILAIICNLSRLTNLLEQVNQICDIKLNDSYLSLFMLAILCNIMIYIAVEGYSVFKSSIIKIITLFMGISIFVICGFEHCIADMFYFAFAGRLNFDIILRLLIIIAGNTFGGITIRQVLKEKK